MVPDALTLQRAVPDAIVILSAHGHSSIVLTSNTYGHVLEQRQQQVAEGLDAVLGG